MNLLSLAISEYLKDSHPEWCVEVHPQDIVEIVRSIPPDGKVRDNFIIIDTYYNILSIYVCPIDEHTIIDTYYTETTLLQQITAAINRINA